jgi:hypothetical protein
VLATVGPVRGQARHGQLRGAEPALDGQADNFWNAGTLFLLTPTHREAERLARIADEEDWGGEVHLYTNLADTDRALGLGRQQYGLLSVWWD